MFRYNSCSPLGQVCRRSSGLTPATDSPVFPPAACSMLQIGSGAHFFERQNFCTTRISVKLVTAGSRFYTKSYFLQVFVKLAYYRVINFTGHTKIFRIFENADIFVASLALKAYFRNFTFQVLFIIM